MGRGTGKESSRDILLGKNSRTIGPDSRGWPKLLKPEDRARPVVSCLYEIDNYFRTPAKKNINGEKLLGLLKIQENLLGEYKRNKDFKDFDSKLLSHLRLPLLELTDALIESDEIPSIRSAVRPYVFGDRNGVTRLSEKGTEVFVSGIWVPKHVLPPLFNSVSLDDEGKRNISELLLQTDEREIAELINKGYVIKENGILRPSEEFAYLILFVI